MQYNAFEVLVIPACRGALLGMAAGLVVLSLLWALDTFFPWADAGARTDRSELAFRPRAGVPLTRRRPVGRR